MKVAFLFPGQGMEEARMGASATASGLGLSLIERAEAAAGAPLRRLLIEGGRAFTQTETLQPLLTAVCLAITAQLQSAGLHPSLCAGHSLGELIAWSAAGGASALSTVELAARRGRLMAREAARRSGGMVALIEANESQVEAALTCGRQHGELSLATWNSPQQAVLSGDVAALSVVLREFPSRRLQVSGAWHSAAMAGAQDELLQALRASASSTFSCEFYSGMRGESVVDPAQAAQLLSQQLVSPLRWMETLSAIAQSGVTDYVTVGPGRVMRGLVRNVLGASVRVHSAFDVEDAARTAQLLLGGA